jgi:predicted flap endonuclease-1-like 5' DNA nuclease
MTRWTQPANLEAFDWFAPKDIQAPTAPAPVPAIVAQPTLETPVEAALEPITAAAEAVAETAEALAEPVVQTVEETADAAPTAADDLTRLVGIGPKLAQRLGDLGVRTFSDIAAWTDEDLASFDRQLDLKGRAVRDAWVAQARRFAEG